MKFTRFLSMFLSLFFILIGMEKVLGMESVSEKCEVCNKGECSFYVFDEQMLVDLKKVCGWDCAVNYINKCREEFGDEKLKISLSNSKCSICKSELSNKNDICIMKCEHTLCKDCRVGRYAYTIVNNHKEELCPVCHDFIHYHFSSSHDFINYPFLSSNYFGKNLQKFRIIKNIKDNDDTISIELSVYEESKEFRDFLKANMNKIEINVGKEVIGCKTPDSQIALLALAIRSDYLRNYGWSMDFETFKEEFSKIKKISFHMIERDKYQIRYEK